MMLTSLGPSITLFLVIFIYNRIKNKLLCLDAKGFKVGLVKYDNYLDDVHVLRRRERGRNMIKITHTLCI